MINIMKRKKGLLAFALSVAMMVSMTPLTAFAESWPTPSYTSTMEVNADEYSVTASYDTVTVTAAEYGTPAGIRVTAINDNTAEIIGGDISVKVPDESSQCGIDAYIGDVMHSSSGHLKMTTGNISSGDDGVLLWSMCKSSADVTVNGNITAGLISTEDDQGAEVYASDYSSAKLVVKGNIEASTKGLYVESTDNYDTQTTSTASVEVYGNVTANAGEGICFFGKAPSNDVLVTGTVFGNYCGVLAELIEDRPDLGENNLTVWKIVAGSGNARGMFMKIEDSDGFNFSEDLDAAKATKYIIKSGKNVKPLKADGTALDKSHNYPVAKEGEKIIITAANGGVVKKAYNDGKEITTKDENGFFYVVVPRGGGINLTAEIGKAANTLDVKGKTATVKYKKLKKNTQTLKVSKVLTFKSKGQGTLTYKFVSAKKGKKSFKKYFKVNKTTGKVTVKKGLKKGTYKVKVKVKAAGNANYKASALKTVTFTVKVK